MARILITGAGGQLGQALVEALNQEHTVLAMPSKSLDITSVEAVNDVFSDTVPDLVINAAAYTAVDAAESNQQIAYQVNCKGVEHLASACATSETPLIHYSTDYVFNGMGSRPWREDDQPEPLNVYGQSKLCGERTISGKCKSYWIFRTSWVYSHLGNNFLRTMIRLGKEREELRVIDDQIGAPTSARFLAEMACKLLINNKTRLADFIKQTTGLYHLTCKGETSWHGYAVKIFDELNNRDMSIKVNKLSPIASSQYPTEAKRPLNSRLNCQKFEKTFNLGREDWDRELVKIIKLIPSE